MGTLAWLFVLAVGIAVAFFAGRMSAPRTERLRNLERERDAAAGEVRRYQEEVNAHFEKTGKLFDQLTGDYRALYEHLADGAGRLGTTDHGEVLQAAPERRKLGRDEDREPDTDKLRPDQGNTAEGAETASQEQTGPADPAPGGDQVKDHERHRGEASGTAPAAEEAAEPPATDAPDSARQSAPEQHGPDETPVDRPRAKEPDGRDATEERRKD